MKKLLILLSFLPLVVFAASLNPNPVYTSLVDPLCDLNCENGGVFTATPGNSCYFFDNSNVYQGEQQNCNGKYFMGGDLFSIPGNDFREGGTFGAPPVTVTIMEAEAGNVATCEGSISNCRSLPSFVNEFTISVLLTTPAVFPIYLVKIFIFGFLAVLIFILFGRTLMKKILRYHKKS